MPKQIVFIHGMFMTPRSWEKWIAYFTQAGYECIAPAWPLHEREPASLRANIPPGTGNLALEGIIQQMERVVARCGEPPILIGHSIGGLIVQVLVNRGLAAAGVAISPVAPNAMLSLDWHFLKSSMPILNPMKGNAPQEMSEERFHETFGNVLSEAQSRSEYEKYAVHESRNVLRTALGQAGRVDFHLDHAPLLLISGAKDHIIPHSLVHRNFLAYPAEAGEKALHIFPNHGHHICNEPGWRDVVSYVEGWLTWHDLGTDTMREVAESIFADATV